MKTIRVAVIGGGLAGLTSAYLLKKIDQAFDENVVIESMVFESTDRLGSHIQGRRNFKVADTDHEILSLAREMKLELVPILYEGAEAPLPKLMTALVSDMLSLKSKGIIKNPEDWIAKDENFLVLLDSMSIVDYFVKKGEMADEVRRALSSSLLASYAEDLDALSALDAFRFMSQYLRCKSLYEIKDGVEALTQALLNSINADQQRVFINCSVSAIDWIDNCWQITFDDGRQDSFDYVIMSQPQRYQQQNDTIYFKPGQRYLMCSNNLSESGLFFAEEFTTIEAPASMNSAVKSAYRVVHRGILPEIFSSLPGEDDLLMPTVKTAVFASGNDAQLDVPLT